MKHVISMIESRQGNLESNIDDILDEINEIKKSDKELKELLELRRQEVKSCKDAIKYLTDTFLTESA